MDVSGILLFLHSLSAAKYGVHPSECVPLVQHVRSSCPHLSFAGLMTIGMPDYSSKPQNFEVWHLSSNPTAFVLSSLCKTSMQPFFFTCTLSACAVFLYFRGLVQCLDACRRSVCEQLGLKVEDVELSMGMSNDFEQAVSGRSIHGALQHVLLSKQATISLSYPAG